MLPYINYHYYVMNNDTICSSTIDGSSIDLYSIYNDVFSENIPTEISFFSDKLEEFAKEKLTDFVNNLPDVESWYIDSGSSYCTIGYPDYSNNYDTIEDAITREKFIKSYEETINEIK